jgi:hypothetical protein
MSMVKKRRGLRLIITIEIITNIRKLDTAGIAGIEYVKRLFSRNGDVCGDVGCGVHLRVNGVSTSVS